MNSLLLTFSFLHFAALSYFVNEKGTDFQEQYLGIYNVTGNQTVASVGPEKNYIDSGITDGELIVSKHQDSSKLKIKFKAFPEVLVSLEGNTFNIIQQSTQNKLPTGSYGVTIIEGNGYFVNNKITINFLISAVAEKATLKNITTVSGSKIR